MCKSGKFLASMLDTVVHTPVVVQRQVPWLVETVQNLWEVPQLALSLGQVDDMPAGVSTL